MYCQCESSLCSHNKNKKVHGCNAQAWEKDITRYGKYYFCRKCADHYDKAGYSYSREKLTK